MNHCHQNEGEKFDPVAVVRICRIVEKRNETRLARFYIAKKVQTWSTLSRGKNICTEFNLITFESIISLFVGEPQALLLGFP